MLNLIEKFHMMREEMLQNRSRLSIEARLNILEDLVYENCRQISELLGFVSRTTDQVGEIVSFLNNKGRR